MDLHFALDLMAEHLWEDPHPDPDSSDVSDAEDSCEEEEESESSSEEDAADEEGIPTAGNAEWAGETAEGEECDGAGGCENDAEGGGDNAQASCVSEGGD